MEPDLWYQLGSELSLRRKLTQVLPHVYVFLLFL